MKRNDYNDKVLSVFNYRDHIKLDAIYNQDYEFFMDVLVNHLYFRDVRLFLKRIQEKNAVDKNISNEYSIYNIGKVGNDYSVYRFYFVDRMSHAHQVLLRENNSAKYYDFLDDKLILLKSVLDEFFPMDEEMLVVEQKLKKGYNVKR